MGQHSINEVIRLYSVGIISRGSLEEELDGRKTAGTETRRREWSVLPEDYIELFPDGHGTWREIN